MEAIVSQCFKCRQALGLPTPLNFDVGPHPAFKPTSLLPMLSANGFVLLPGLTKWLNHLSPVNCPDAWASFHQPHILNMIREHSAQQHHLFLDDFGAIDHIPQLSVDFAVKKEKSHLTVIEGSDEVCSSMLLPQSLREYLMRCLEFISDFRDYLELFSPVLPFPTVIKMRIFKYRSSDC